MRSLFFLPLLLIGSGLLWQSSSLENATFPAGFTQPLLDSLRLDAPVAVKAIIQNKCYDCHAEGGEEKAMKDLLWDEFPSLHPEDQMYLLDDIVESIEDKEMPPTEHLKKHPEDKLTRQEAKLLIEWASALANKLDKG